MNDKNGGRCFLKNNIREAVVLFVLNPLPSKQKRTVNDALRKAPMTAQGLLLLYERKTLLLLTGFNARYFLAFQMTEYLS